MHIDTQCEILGMVPIDVHFFCSSLLPRKAIISMRELLDTGVDFG